MPSLKSKQRLNQLICLGVSTLLLGTALVGCGSGESEAKYATTPTVTEPKPKNFKIKVPVEMRDITIKIYDNFDNTLVLEKDITTTTDLQITLPKVLNTSHLYRVEINTSPNSLIYNFLTSKYENVSTVLHSIVNVDVSNLTQTIFISPSSEAIYQRALIRSGQLPNESSTSTDISALHLNLATQDVNTALFNAFNRMNIPNLNTSYQLNIFGPQDVSTVAGTNVFTSAFFSFGYIQQWANSHPDNPFTEFTKNLAIDLKDGQLDAKKVRGDATSFESLIPPTPDNVNPEKNNLVDIVKLQENTRNLFASALKQATLQLATNFQQKATNPDGYTLLEQKAYSGNTPTITSTLTFRVPGAGDYRRAIGFVDSTATCNGSIYPCKQGITGINIVNPNLPSIEYLIGHYEDSINNCQLNIRANGVLELIKGSQIYRSVLDADSTDNLLQVDKANREYLLNSSSTEPNNTSLDYSFVQVKIKENQVQSASAGLDNRKAPDQLQTTQLQCSFS